MAEKRDDYKFMKINDAILSINQKVNIVGVVEEYGIPIKSRGSDFFCTLKILDESSSMGIVVKMFDVNTEKLPRIIALGDIILLSRVTMKAENCEAFAVYNKRYSSFALYEGRDCKDFIPYQVSQRFRRREQDKKFIAALRQWLSTFSLTEDLKNFPLIREIQKGDGNKFACQILHTCEAAEGQWILFIWDGTDTPPIEIENNLDDDNIPLQLEPLPLSRHILRMFPTVGSILRITIDQSNKNHILHLLSRGKWMIFQNVHCQVNSGLWYGQLTEFTRLRFLPSDDHLISERLRPFEMRLAMKLGRLPFWCFPWTSRITEVGYNDDSPPFNTLMEVLAYPKVTVKFRCVVRVVAAMPCQAEDIRSPSGIYRMRLTLEDPTARIHAFIYGQDGVEFFDGYPSEDVMRKKLMKLLGVAVGNDGKEIKNAARNPQWVQCCLKSYFRDVHDIWATRNFRIFNTKLIG